MTNPLPEPPQLWSLSATSFRHGSGTIPTTQKRRPLVGAFGSQFSRLLHHRWNVSKRCHETTTGTLLKPLRNHTKKHPFETVSDGRLTRCRYLTGIFPAYHAGTRSGSGLIPYRYPLAMAPVPRRGTLSGTVPNPLPKTLPLAVVSTVLLPPSPHDQFSDGQRGGTAHG